MLVVGDLMLDRYLHGRVDRISPEAPVPVVQFLREEDRLGGAANVARNLLALGCSVEVAGCVGTDADAECLRAALAAAGIRDSSLVSDPERPTTVKTRVVAQQQQLLRVDRESIAALSEPVGERLITAVADFLAAEPTAGIILQDYNKGVLTPRVISGVMAAAERFGVPVSVDPKLHNFWSYRGADLFKPNLREIQQQCDFTVGADLRSLDRAAGVLFERLACRKVMITLSGDGIYTHDGTYSAIHPTEARRISDVSGAGDTVISVAACALSAGMPLQEVAELCNVAGAQVIARPGVVAVDLAELRRRWTERT